jgi:hypothetical protein
LNRPGIGKLFAIHELLPYAGAVAMPERSRIANGFLVLGVRELRTPGPVNGG